MRFLCARPLPAFALALGAGCGGVARDAAVAPAVRDAWVRPAAAGADAALYFTVANPGRDTLTLTGARADVADTATLHASMRMGTGAGAMMHMTPLARVPVPPHDSVAFAPLGRHMMLERLRRSLVVGDSVRFALVVVERGGRPDTLGGAAAVRP